MWSRVMNANFASIMPQAIACWCESWGHDVTLVCHTGVKDLQSELPEGQDLVFIGAFTESAHLAYALSRLLQSKGAVTVLGGPHARCYPQDAQRYFDYVLGFTDQALIHEVLQDCSPHRPLGVHLSANQQPTTLPGVRERWKFIEATLRQAPYLKIVPMLGGLGCPYTCSFCIDAAVPYHAFDFEVMKDDLRFLRTKFKRPRVGWHDPNFGIQFNQCMDAIEEAVPENSIDFIAESSLSILSEPHVQRLKRNGFKALLPGIESWYELGAKSKTGADTGMVKVQKVADQVNMILRHIPYMQTNFVFGLDSDEGPEPFELTKKFLDLAPGTYPAFSMLSSFGQAAVLNLDYQRAGRVLPFPFHFLNNTQMNVRVKNYTWPAFYGHVIDVTRHACSPRMMVNRLGANGASIPGALNLLRAVSTEGAGRIRYYRTIREQLQSDAQFRAYFEQETTELPALYINQIRRDLGPFCEWLPPEAVYHDPYAYLKTECTSASPVPRLMSATRQKVAPTRASRLKEAIPILGEHSA